MIETFEKHDTFITHLPIQLDASCNGLQHLSCIIYEVTKLRSYEVTKLRSYEVTKLRSYEVTKLRSYDAAELQFKASHEGQYC